MWRQTIVIRLCTEQQLESASAQVQGWGEVCNCDHLFCTFLQFWQRLWYISGVFFQMPVKTLLLREHRIENRSPRKICTKATESCSPNRTHNFPEVEAHLRLIHWLFSATLCPVQYGNIPKSSSWMGCGASGSGGVTGECGEAVRSPFSSRTYRWSLLSLKLMKTCPWTIMTNLKRDKENMPNYIS